MIWEFKAAENRFILDNTFLFQPVGAGMDVFENRPKLKAWKDRVREEIGAELFDEAHQAILYAQEAVKTMDPKKMEHFKPKILRYFLS